MNEIDVLLRDFYGKYANENISDEKIKAIKNTYKDDYDTLLKDLYGKFANTQLDQERLDLIKQTYKLVKKKEDTESVSETGSLDSQTTKQVQTTQTPQEAFEAQRRAEAEELATPRQNFYPLVEQYREATALNEDDLAKIEADVDNRLSGTWGEALEKRAKQALNIGIRATTFGLRGRDTEVTTYADKKRNEAFEELMRSGVPLNEIPKQLDAKIREIAIREESERLVEKKHIEYTKNLSEEQRKDLDIERVNSLKSITNKEKSLLIQAELLSKSFEGVDKDIETLDKSLELTYNAIEKLQQEGKQIPKDLINYYNEKLDERNKIAQNAMELVETMRNLESEFEKNISKEIEEREAIELFKKEYGIWENLKANMGIAIGERVVAGGLGLASLWYALAPEDDEKSSIKAEKYGEQGRLMLETMEKARESYRNKMEYTDIRGWNDLFYFIGQATATQAPTFAQILFPYGGAQSIFLTSAGTKRLDILESGQEIGQGRMLASTVAYGSSEYFLGTMPTLGILRRAANTTVTRELFKESFAKGALNVAKQTGVGTAWELTTESATTITQNLGDMFILKDKSVTAFDNVDHTMAETLASMPWFILGGIGVGRVKQKFMPKTDIETVKGNLLKIQQLRQDLEQAESASAKNAINQSILELEQQNETVFQKTDKNISEIDKARFDKIKEITKKQAELQVEAENILNDTGLNPESKTRLIQNLKEQFDGLENQRENIVSGKAQIDDLLPENEVIALKDQAQRELVAEAGEQDVQLNDQQISERALQIYNRTQEEVAPETTTEQVVEETQEVETEQEVSLTEEVKGTPLEGMVGKRAKYNDPVTGETIGGDLYIEGQRLVLETQDRIIDLGNANEVSKQEVLPITESMPTVEMRGEQMVFTGETGTIPQGTPIRPQREGFKSIRRDKDGNIKRVVVVDDKGNTYNLKGQEAIDVAYQMMMNEMSKPAFELKVEQNESAKQEIETELARENKKVAKRKTDEDTVETVQRRDTPRVDETAPTTDTETDAGVRPGTIQDTQQGQDTDVQPTVESETGKTETKKIKAYQNAEFEITTDANGNVTKITNSKGKDVPRFIEQKTKRGKQVRNNPAWKTVVAEYKGELTQNQIRQEEKRTEKAAMDAFVPETARDAALEALAQGQQVDHESAMAETGLSSKEVSWATGFPFGNKTKKPTVTALSEQIHDNLPENQKEKITQRDIKDALIKLISGKTSKQSVIDEIVDIYNQTQSELNAQELWNAMNNMTEQERSIVEAIEAENAYFEGLTEQEKTSYYENRIREQQQAEQVAAEQEAGRTDTGQQSTTESRTQRAETKEVDLAKDLKLDDAINIIDKYLKDIDQFGKETLGMNFPVLVAEVVLTAMKNATQTAKTAADLISAGINALKKTDWYKDLSKKLQKDVVDNFETYINRPFKSNPERTFAEIETEVDQLISEGKIGQDIVDNFNNKREKEIAKDILERRKQYTDEEVAKEMTAEYEKYKETLRNKKPLRNVLKNIARAIATSFTDRQFLPKRLFNKAGLRRSRNLMINTKGAPGLAKAKFEQAINDVFGDKVTLKDESGKVRVKYNPLTRKKRDLLNQLIFYRRVIEIENNREQRGLPPIRHWKNINKAKAEAMIRNIEKQLSSNEGRLVVRGNQVTFKDLNRRADKYFSIYKDLLESMHKSGLISDASYDSMKNLDYSPRVLLAPLLDFNGDVTENGGRRNREDSGGISDNIIQSIKEGSEGAFVMDAEWLLSSSLSSGYRKIFLNNTNKMFAREFKDNRARFNEVKNKIKNKEKLSKKDREFYEAYKELDSKIIDNPVVDIKDGKPVFKYDKSPNANFERAYYWENGNRYEFFIEKDLHKQWFDNLSGLFDKSESVGREVLSWLSGSAVLKMMATGHNPSFFLVNMPRDFAFTWTLSSHYSMFLPVGFAQQAIQSAKAINDIRKFKMGTGTTLLEKAIEYGLTFDFLSQEGQIQNTMAGKVLGGMLQGKASYIGKDLFNKITLDKLNTYSELTFRIGIMQRYIKNRLRESNLKDINDITDALAEKEGYYNRQDMIDDIYETAVAEARGILDFSQGGRFAKDMEAVLPYTNVILQSARRLGDRLRENPVETVVRTTQVAAFMSSVVFGLPLIVLSALRSSIDDEDKDEKFKDMTNAELLLYARDGLSEIEKINYMHIPTGLNEDGEFNFIRIAKEHAITPFVTYTDWVFENYLRRQYGLEEKDSDVLVKNMRWAFDNNISLVETQSPGSIVTAVPAVRAVATWYSGYDFFRDRPLTGHGFRQIPKAAEGLGSPNIEDFYKKMGKEYDISPARTKAAVESYITSPNTNPFVGVLYAGADIYWDEDVNLKKAKDNLLGTIKKSTYQRVVRSSSDFNRRRAMDEKAKKEVEKQAYIEEETRIKGNELIRQYHSKEITFDEFKEEAFKLYPRDRSKLFDKYKDFQKRDVTDKTLVDIKYWSGSVRQRAMYVYYYYGNIFDGSDESINTLKQMRELGGFLTDDFKDEYRRILIEKSGN